MTVYNQLVHSEYVAAQWARAQVLVSTHSDTHLRRGILVIGPASARLEAGLARPAQHDTAAAAAAAAQHSGGAGIHAQHDTEVSR